MSAPGPVAPAPEAGTAAAGSCERRLPAHADVVVVGAGLSGIGAAYRLRTQCPQRSVVVLEARDALGGTWDLFRYPGVRSDSDMFTLSYPFRPWREPESIAEGGAILRYLRESAAELGVEELVRYRTRVVDADWSSRDQRWGLVVERPGPGGTVERGTMTCGFLYLCAGYYDDRHPYDADLPGLSSYAGTVVHPQSWPTDLDLTGRRVLVVGSGATAVTLVPRLAELAAGVSMLQRSPTWIGAVPRHDRVADRLRSLLPAGPAHQLARVENIVVATAFYQLCRRRPRWARSFLLGGATRAVGSAEVVAEHFTPTYDPWDQRLCASPDGDLFTAVRDGTVEMVTDTIDTFVPEGVRVSSGRVLEADVVVTATGLALRTLGGIEPTVDHAPVSLPEQFVWRGALISGLPNLAVCIGYTNASWTLRADLSSRLVCRVLNEMAVRGWRSVVPAPSPHLQERPLLELTAGYVRRSVGAFPRQGDRAPWRVRQNYVLDRLSTLRRPLDRELQTVPVLRREPPG